MFVWAKIAETYATSQDFCIALLERAGVSVTPGSAFGALGEGYVRFALVRTQEEMARPLPGLPKAAYWRDNP